MAAPNVAKHFTNQGLRFPGLTGILAGFSGGFVAAAGDVVTDAVRFILRIAWRCPSQTPQNPIKN